MSGETKMAFSDCHREGLCIGVTVYFHVCNMVPVSDLKDASQTTKVENIQLPSNGFSHLTFTFSHLADAFIQSDLQLGNT